MRTLPLNKSEHDRKRFDCDNEALNNYLQLMASQQSKRDHTRTFIIEDEINSSYIMGYYSLTMIAINLDSIPSSLQKKHQNIQSAGLIARLAVDKHYQKKGYGEFLLVDALQRLLLASESVAFPLIVVDAKEGALEFYTKFGFQKFLDDEDRLFITVDSVRKSFK